MDFRQLETFVEVVKLKSFSKAADKLYLTQPTITNHIQNLENELGTLLINRLGKNISATEAGTLLYKHALNIINMRDMAQFAIGSYKGKIQGHLNISSSSIPRQYVLPYILKEFSQKYPEITFSINDNDSRNVIENILSGVNDFGIVGAKFHSPHLDYIDLIEDELVVVAPSDKKYNLADKSTLDLDTILQENVILREKGSGSRLLFEKALKNSGVDLNKLNVVACIKDTATIKKFIELKTGISIISKRAIEREVELGLFKSYDIKNISLKRNFYFVYHKNRHLSPLGQAFRNFVIEYVSVNRNI
ncbi:selenium metabolism-associated LysR family transcriptional regulator [Sporosalibacterium faouarense]|uniref:selenium metabolism-associated LysR family transcriptional regulator n=1 Tax=Sporosalibacterium faouarense TaxID=516123 RepID=UPI00141D6E43|nr:selenium metabolism-associated LysR family transcriptional regulator [Sporosalibacterium faouarense]MTI48577.1 LysR family transcriptional regulator [Bacillota bacterium]